MRLVPRERNSRWKQRNFKTTERSIESKFSSQPINKMEDFKAVMSELRRQQQEQQ